MPGLADRLRSSLSNEPEVVWTRRPEVLLCGQVPKPMHQLAPRTILGQRWWDETRQAAYASTGYHCVACGVSRVAAAYHQWLEGHELYRIDHQVGRMHYLETVPLCHLCHNFIHAGRLQALLDGGEIAQRKFTDVMLHGERVLREAKLKPPEIYEGPIADWGKWRLVLNGKEYKPVFKTYEAWLKKFGGD